MRKGNLYVLSGPSGAGKGTVCKMLLSNQTKLHLSISATTRDPREGEVDGREYFFKTREAFEAMIQNGELLEYAVFNGNYYGTPKKYVEDILDRGEDVLLEIEVQGAGQIKEQRPDAVLIFLYPPSMEELEKRLRNRGTETEDVILARLKRAKEEMQLISLYDYAVENDTVERAVVEIEAIMTAEKLRAKNFAK